MIALATGLILIPVLDQALKLLVLRRLAAASIPLGPFGRLQVLSSRIWLERPGFLTNRVTLWSTWILAAGSLAIVCGLFPTCGKFAGMLLGGALSHALETSLRGCVIDYVRLRFWPAFNLADVAITIGALGVLVEMVLQSLQKQLTWI